MKKIFFAILFFTCGMTTVQAQDYQPFRVDMGLGFGLPFEDYNPGFIMYLEPKYALNTHFSAGLRGEMLWTGGKHLLDLILPTTFIYSVMPTADYYILPKALFRPFAGAGLGAYIIPGETVETTAGTPAYTQPTRTNFGVMARLGVDVWHIRLSAEYNYAGKDADDFTLNYISVKAGFFIGGGKR